MAGIYVRILTAVKFVLILNSLCSAVTQEQREDAILNILLQKLDLQEVPDVSSAPALMPEYMKHVYELTGHYRGDRAEEVSVAALSNRRLHYGNRRTKMTFTNSDVRLLRNAVEAELVFDIDRDLDVTCELVRTKMCLTPRNCSDLIDAEVSVEDAFLMVDVTPHLHQLQKLFNDSLAQPVITVAMFDFAYRAATRNGSVALVLHGMTKEELADGIELDDDLAIASPRQRRAIPEQSPEEGVCAVYPWQVRFADIGWDFVVEPKQFVPNFCSGTCELTDQPVGYYIANHALIKYHFQREGHIELPTIPTQTCCVPRRMNPLSVVYSYGNGTVINRLLSEMEVIDCACY